MFEDLLGVNLFTAIFTLANTVALFLVLKKFLFKPVMKVITDRQKEIDDSLAEAEQAKQDAQVMRQEYEQKLSDATQTGERIVKEAVARGQSREEEIIRQANREAEAIREKAAEDVQREKRKAVNDAKNEISGIALAIAGKVVGRELNEQDQSDLVDSFIDQLGEQA
ncbi:MAG: F0F1 ATP synthase subunit B [Oscillospiraceae bacterium]|nr:F0F1 ATP synthase subunit B [Oscillospiraceae bacterium]